MVNVERMIPMSHRCWQQLLGSPVGSQPELRCEAQMTPKGQCMRVSGTRAGSGDPIRLVRLAILPTQKGDF